MLSQHGTIELPAPFDGRLNGWTSPLQPDGAVITRTENIDRQSTVEEEEGEEERKNAGPAAASTLISSRHRGGASIFVAVCYYFSLSLSLFTPEQ